MGSFNFNYADKTGVASKGFILIPKFAQKYFQTNKIKVTAYKDYGRFKAAKNKLVDLHVIQGIVLSILENETPDFSVENIFFSEYDYKSKLEKYRVKSTNYEADNLMVNYGNYKTSSKSPMKVVSDETLSYEATTHATISGQFTKSYCPDPVEIETVK